MKRILITGANSYIGTSFEKFIKENHSNEYEIDTLDMIDGTWRKKDFSGYDSVFHVAGIAHIKETKDNAQLYYKINRDLAVETAETAKRAGVKQFIFLSTMSVYGMETGIITKKTIPNPNTHYGKSKFQAEKKIQQLSSESFKICVLRPPMVYGNGCKGNFQSVLKLVKLSPVFPKVNNQRSMIYIDNLCSFVELCIDKQVMGVYCPQNREYVRTSDMAKIIAESIGKKVWMSTLAGGFIYMIRPAVNIAKKAFGNLIYQNVDDFEYNYCIVENLESIRRSVK